MVRNFASILQERYSTTHPHPHPHTHKYVGTRPIPHVISARRSVMFLLAITVAFSHLFLGCQSNTQTDGEQKASTREWGCSVSSKSHRNQTHVNGTPSSLPNDQTHLPTQFLKASNCHTAPDGEHSRRHLGELFSQMHPCLFYKAIHMSWTQSSRESAISCRINNLEDGAGWEAGDRARLSWESREGICTRVQR